jgi:hypothetical protein
MRCRAGLALPLEFGDLRAEPVIGVRQRSFSLEPANLPAVALPKVG